MNKFRPGFTIVELLIVIVIMASFIAIGSFGFIKLKESAEAQQYENSVRKLASTLDESYLSGLTPSGEPYLKGSYPPLTDNNWGLMTKDMDWYMSTFEHGEYDEFYVFGAELSDTTNPYPMFIENDWMKLGYDYKYIMYQPLTKDNELCIVLYASPEIKPCVKFNIYFFKKDDNGIYNFSKIMSKYR